MAINNEKAGQLLSKIYAIIADNGTDIERWIRIAEMLKDTSELYGCTNPEANNYCAACLWEKDPSDCTFSAPPGNET